MEWRAITEQERLGFAGRDATSGCSKPCVYLLRTGQLALERVVVRRISLLATWDRPIKVTWQGVERLVSSFMVHTCRPSHVVFLSPFLDLPHMCLPSIYLFFNIW